MRPLERVGFRVEHEQDGYVLFEKDGIKIYIEMLGKDLEPSIGFAEAEEVTEMETKWHYTAVDYHVLVAAMEEASYFATLTLELRKKV